MALVTDTTLKHLKKTVPTVLGSELWNSTYGISDKVPASGIYRCTGCGDEITSNKGQPFPPQNKDQHECQGKPVRWQLVVQTQTKGPNGK